MLHKDLTAFFCMCRIHQTPHEPLKHYMNKGLMEHILGNV